MRVPYRRLESEWPVVKRGGTTGLPRQRHMRSRQGREQRVAAQYHEA